MPFPKLPFPKLHAGRDVGRRSIVDPKEFWANALYLARLSNGGLGIENVDVSDGLPLSVFERQNASVPVHFELSVWPDIWFSSWMPLMVMPVDYSSLKSIAVSSPAGIPGNQRFLANLSPSSDHTRIIATLDSLHTGFDDFVVTPENGGGGEGSPTGTIDLQIVCGSCAGITLNFEVPLVP
jgi:hypothetical protein